MDNIGISTAAISNNIEAMRGKYLRRVGPDKGGFLADYRIKELQNRLVSWSVGQLFFTASIGA
jgi:hypothetical protein